MRRLPTVAIIVIALLILTPLIPGSEAYKVVNGGSMTYNQLLGQNAAVGYYDDGIWLWVSTAAPTTVTISDSGWEHLYSWPGDNSHIFVNHNRSSGIYSVTATATQIGSVSGLLSEQTRTFTFDLEVDCFEIASWQLRVLEHEFDTSRLYYEMGDVVIRETDSIFVNAQTPFDRYIRMQVNDLPEGVVANFIHGNTLQIEAADLVVGTHRIQLCLEYGLPLPSTANPEILLYGQTIHIDFNVTVLPDDEVIVTSPVTDVIEGDYFQYTPEADGRPCHLEWNDALSIPAGMNIQRSQINGIVRESIHGIATQSFLISFQATVVYGMRTLFQNITINVHPLLTQRLVGSTSVNEGDWRAILTTTGPANVTFEGLPDSISVMTQSDTVHHLIGTLSAGTYEFTVQTTSDYVRTQYDNQTYVLTVLPALSFLSQPSTNSNVSESWQYSPVLNDENAVITILEGPDWASLVDGTIQGVPEEAGNYYFEIAAYREDPADSAVQIFTLKVQPAVLEDDLPMAAFIPYPNQMSIHFRDTSLNAMVYSWDFGDGNFSNESSPTYQYAAVGTYFVTLTVSNDNGSDSYSRTLVVRITAPLVPEDPTAEDPEVQVPSYQYYVLLLISAVLAVSYYFTHRRILLVLAVVLAALYLALYFVF